MSTKNIFITAAFAIIAFSVVGYIYWTNVNKISGEPFLFIPDDPAVIVQFDEPGKVFGKLLEDTTVWESLTQSALFMELEKDVLHLGSLLNSKPEYFGQLKKSPLIVSFHPDQDNQKTHILLLSKVGVVPFHRDLSAFLEKRLGAEFVLEDFESDGFKGFRITNLLTERSIMFVFADGVLVASSEKEMIIRAIAAYGNKKTHFSRSRSFVRLRETSGNKVDGRLFIHYKQLGNLLKPYANPKTFAALGWLNNFAGWTETDLLLMSNELLLSGFTDYDKSKGQFLSRFANQLGSEDNTINILPFNTSIALRQGFSDFSTYYNKYLKPGISRADRAYTDVFSQYVGSEVALASTAVSDQEFEVKTLAIVKLQSKKKARKLLNDFARKLNSRTVQFENYTIRQIKHSGMLQALFGKIFSVIENNYFVFVSDYVVFANSPDGLINFLQTYKTGKTLDLNEGYVQFSDNLSTTANITLYIDPDRIINLLPRFLNDETAIGFMESAEAISHFKGLAFQFCSGESSLFYSNFYLYHGSAGRSGNISQWQISLSDEIVGRPYLVKDHKTNKYNVVVFDKSANMYLISTDGVILWKKRLDNLPISRINEVDYYKNGKIQYLFNTFDFIYLIDRNGQMVKNYPRKLNPSATNGLSLFDYNSTKDYRLLISLADKWTYNYTIRGTQVEGWVKPRMNNLVYEPVTRLVINDKDYIIITDEKNNVKIVNRRGEVRIDLEKNPDKAKNSSYFENKTNKKGIIITTNKSGKLVYFNADGKLKQTDFGDFSPQHFFLYEDFNNDGSADFIFLDKKDLVVFNRLKKEVFRYRFNSEIKIKPVFFKIGRNQKVLGVVADKEKTIYLFDSKGNTIVSKGLVGETPFTVGSLNNNRELNLITAAGSTLFNYRLN